MTLRNAILASTLAAALVSFPATAQTPVARKDPPLTITVQVSMFLPGPTGTPEEESALQQQGRALVYKMGAAECAVVTASIPGECRLSQVRVSSTAPAASSVIRAGSAAPRSGTNISGSFTLTIAQKP